jgi:hypothetical protein
VPWGDERRLWAEIKVLILDEISMLSGEFLDHLDWYLKYLRWNFW